MLSNYFELNEITASEFNVLQSLDKQGQTDVAISLAKKMLNKYPMSAALYNFLGVVNSNIGKHANALLYFKKTIELSPDFSDAHNNLGVNYLALGDYLNARQCFETAITLEPNNARFHYNISKPLYANSEHKSAIEHLKRAIRLRDNYLVAMNDLGNCMMMSGKVQESISIYKNVLTKDPTFTEAYGNLGIAYSKLGNLEAAKTNYLKALELDPNCNATKLNLVGLLKMLGENNKPAHTLIQLDSDLKKIGKTIIYSATDAFLTEKVDQMFSMLDFTQLNLTNNISQLFKSSDHDLNCNRHLKLFEEMKVIPEYCFGCFKVQVEVNSVLDLIRLASLFYSIRFSEDLTTKCMIETRDTASGFYKGFIYCSSLKQATTVKTTLERARRNLEWMSAIKIKHGCTEYTSEYPEFEVSENTDTQMQYPVHWKTIESEFDEQFSIYPEQNKLPSYVNFCLSDILVIERWIDYAKGIGDKSVNKLSDRALKYRDTFDLAHNRLQKFSTCSV